VVQFGATAVRRGLLARCVHGRFDGLRKVSPLWQGKNNPNPIASSARTGLTTIAALNVDKPYQDLPTLRMDKSEAL
jgi:hypothetical protein